MRNKELLERKIDKIDRSIRLIGYHVHREEREEAYGEIDRILEVLQDVQTLLRTETQD